MKVKKVWTLLVVLIVGFLVSETISAAESITTKDYWVLRDGYSAGFTNGSNLTVTYQASEGLYYVDLMGTGTQLQDYDTSGNLMYYGTKWAGGGYFTVSPGKALFPAVLEVGKTYPAVSWQRDEYDDQGVYHGAGSDSAVVTVTGPQSLTVPAGSFITYKFNLVDTWFDSWGQSGVSTSEYWLAEGVGWVKIIRGGVTYELKSYTGPPSAPQLSVTTSGITVSPSWSTSLSANGYTLFYAPYPNPDPILSIDMGTQTGGSFNLWNGAAFYLAVQAYNSFGNSAYSNIVHFVIDIAATAPTVTTGSATSVTSTSATLNGTVNPNGSSTTYYFQYGTTSSYGSTTTSTSAGSGTSNVSASASVSGLSFDTAYHYRLVAANSGGTSYGTDGTFTTSGFGIYTNGLGQTFKLIPAGTFTMGSPSNEPGRGSDEGPQHQVTLTQSFYMMTTEVTQSQWQAVMGNNPSYFSGCPACPVEKVSWNDVQSYITQMNTRGEGTYSLPTEAQWEYAARAGSDTAFYNGGITEMGCGYDPNLDAIGWYCYNANSKTHPVAGKTPNAWGLYDTSGNVYEWVQDWYGSYPSSAVTDPTGPSSGSTRVRRGGDWYYYARYCRSAHRASTYPAGRYSDIGFRLLRQP